MIILPSKALSSTELGLIDLAFTPLCVQISREKEVRQLQTPLTVLIVSMSWGNSFLLSMEPHKCLTGSK